MASIEAGDITASPKTEVQKKLHELLEYADERCKELIQDCAAKDLPLPENGYEIQDDQGRVCAEAELAWPSKKVAVLLPEQSEAEAIFQERGWKVFGITMPSVEILALLKE